MYFSFFYHWIELLHFGILVEDESVDDSQKNVGHEVEKYFLP